ncbi:MAG: tetratricopeptide repeat protein [Sedimentisphaerales bacterium]
MKTNVYRMIKFILPIVVLASLCAEIFALENEIGDPTVPASSIKSGLVRTPSPVDASGNLVVTGRVRGGKYFRGLVPYRDETEFGAPLGSEDIGSFLRNTAPVTSLRSSLSPQPYYLPSSTVSSTARGTRNVVLTYPNIGSTGDYDTTELPKVQVHKPSQLAAEMPLYDYTSARLLSYDSTDLERVITYDLIQQRNKKELSDALQKASEDVDKKTLLDDQKAKDSLIDEPQKPLERAMPAEPARPGDRQTDKTQTQNISAKTVYEQMLQEVASAHLNKPDVQDKEKTAEEQEQKQEQQKEKAEDSEVKERQPGDLQSEYSRIDKDTAEATVGVHKSFATQANDKFNYYMRTAEEFLKAGKYYRAADAYSMAGIYKSDDPLAFAGKSHALFASGEYMSSAYFLSRAINIFPQYVKFKIGLVEMIPDKDRLESRIADIKAWIQRSDSPELSFLLAYIYYQLDKIELATEAINSAAAKIPDSIPVTALKQAIEKK